jgi:tetratricopeptide (TPR) repeat protein
MRISVKLFLLVSLFIQTATCECYAQDSQDGEMLDLAEEKLDLEGLQLYSQGKLKEAEAKFLLARKAIDPWHPRHIEVEFALADIHERLGNLSDAIREYSWALFDYEGVHGLKDPQVADKLEHFAKMLHAGHEDHRAQIAEAEAKEVREGKVADYPPGTASMDKDGTISLSFGPDNSFDYKPNSKYYKAILSHVKPLYPETSRWLLPGNLPKDWPEFRENQPQSPHLASSKRINKNASPKVR